MYAYNVLNMIFFVKKYKKIHELIFIKIIMGVKRLKFAVDDGHLETIVLIILLLLNLCM